MPVEQTDGAEPLKGRQETFCQIMAKEETSAAEAYRQAGYSQNGAHTHANRLVTKGHIKARIAYIKAEWAKKREITREGQAVKLDVAYELARQQENSQAMSRAVEVQNRLYGLDKQILVSEASEAAKQLSEQERKDAEEFEQWKMRKRLKATKAG